MTEQLDGQVSMFDLVSQYGKTSLEHSVPTKEQTSKPSLKPCAKSKTPMLQYLCLKEINGFLPDASWETVTQLPGVFSTLNITEYPSDVRESTLSQILDLNAPEKYNLSEKACRGILRRAEQRGKELPSMLRDALNEVVGNSGI